MLRTVAALALSATTTLSWASVCGDAHTSVADIQGRGTKSPMVGEQVTVEGILTVDVRQPGGFHGFYLQQALTEQDTDPTTSEGLFVHTNARPGSPGDRVRVTGEVAEYYGLTSLSQVDRVDICTSPGLPTPAALVLASQQAIDRETMEGMLVRTTTPLTVTDTWNLARYGELVLAPTLQRMPTQVLEPGLETQALAAQQEQQRLLLDDGQRRKHPRPIPYLSHNGTPGHPLRVGDQVAPVTGVLDYRFGSWRLQPLTQPEVHHANPRQMPPERHRDANLRVVSLNLGNLFNGNGQGNGFPTERGARSHQAYQQQLGRLAGQIRATDPDILAVAELENDGYGQRSALADLATALGDQWRYVEGGTNSGDDAIRNALLYRADVVRPAGAATLIDNGAFRRWHRPALAQAFRLANGESAITVVAVHLKSKSCRNAPPAQQNRGDGQACYTAAREAATRALGDWSSATPGDGRAILLVGDFNAYARETPMTLMRDAGYTDLVAQFHGLDQQTFRFHGRVGTLDYHLASSALAGRVMASYIWSVNAEEPRFRAYDANPPADTPPDSLWRASDHNPVISDIQL